MKDMQIKITMKYHLTLVRMAMIKSIQITSAGEDVEKGGPCYTVCGNINWCSHCGERFEGFSDNYK